jgi:hypothetical protein
MANQPSAARRRVERYHGPPEASNRRRPRDMGRPHVLPDRRQTMLTPTSRATARPIRRLTVDGSRRGGRPPGLEPFSSLGRRR